jgi:hypothetical protein
VQLKIQFLPGNLYKDTNNYHGFDTEVEAMLMAHLSKDHP